MNRTVREEFDFHAVLGHEYVCVCLCVCEREREREVQIHFIYDTQRTTDSFKMSFICHFYVGAEGMMTQIYNLYV